MSGDVSGSPGGYDRRSRRSYSALASLASIFILGAGALGLTLSLEDDTEGPITIPAQAQVIQDWPHNNQVAIQTTPADADLINCGANTNPFWGDENRAISETPSHVGVIVVCNLAANDVSNPPIARISFDTSVSSTH